MPTGNTVCVPCVLDRETDALDHYRGTIGIVHYVLRYAPCSACGAASDTLPRVCRHCPLALTGYPFVTETAFTLFTPYSGGGLFRRVGRAAWGPRSVLLLAEPPYL